MHDFAQLYPIIAIDGVGFLSPGFFWQPRLTAPLCQEAAVLAVDIGLFDEVMVKPGAGVEDLDADEVAVLPVQRGESADAAWPGGLGRGAVRCEWATGEVDLHRVGGGVVGDPHAPIVPRRSARSERRCSARGCARQIEHDDGTVECTAGGNCLGEQAIHAPSRSCRMLGPCLRNCQPTL
jgi:hypothetical protein